MKDTVRQSPKIRVLVELRPAFDGFAGIPQETRLLFRGLRMLESCEVAGMLQTSGRKLAKGVREQGLLPESLWLTEAQKINRYSRVLISAAERPYVTLFEALMEAVERRLDRAVLTLRTLLGMSSVRLTSFRTTHFEDFVWRTLFSKSLPASDFDLVTRARQFVCSTPWQSMHVAGLRTLTFGRAAKYPRLMTPGTDVFITQTPYPGRVSRGTSMVVRYHDAVPVFMPHTIGDVSLHQASHFYALAANVKAGARFACVSGATRNDLLRLFPGAESQSEVIYNMVSHHYFSENSSPELVPGIIRTRLMESDAEKGIDVRPKFLSLREQESFYSRSLQKKPFRYLLCVATIEPRKNHARLLAAWEVLKAETDPDLKLVVVGSIGWNYLKTVQGFRPWIDRGELFMLNAVPAPDLRVLYRHAAATVCPSVSEGFDFSGVEAMRSGGVVIASGIEVHREVYGDGAKYFDPYSTADLVGAVKKVLYADDGARAPEELRRRGHEVSARYLPAQILPQWEAFLSRVVARRSGAGAQRAVAAPPLHPQTADAAEEN
jgi:glycosyltransferase involved in cell wall biosynthesis